VCGSRPHTSVDPYVHLGDAHFHTEGSKSTHVRRDILWSEIVVDTDMHL